MFAAQPDFLPRHIRSLIYEHLKYVRIVAIIGPRQSGKTTLLRQIARDRQMIFRSFDEKKTRDLALLDLDDFIAGESRHGGGMAIDEVGRLPEAFLALKWAVDNDTRPGRFIITGSVDLLSSSLAPDSLAGRIKFIELWPLSQAEIQQTGAPFRLFDDLFAGRSIDRDAVTAVSRAELIDQIIRGGFPDFYAIDSEVIRSQLLQQYAQVLLKKDVKDLLRVHKVSQFADLLSYLSLLSGTIISHTRIGSDLGVDDKTVNHWISVLEQLFLVRRLRAWHKSKLKRHSRRSKLFFLDTSLMLALSHHSYQSMSQDAKLIGTFVENYVYSEIVKTLACSMAATQIMYYRDAAQVEVDFVLERENKLIAVEVKAARTIQSSDLVGIKKVQSLHPRAAGIVFYGGHELVPLKSNICLIPIAYLWHDKS